MSKANLDQFLLYLEKQLGSIYVWSAQGETVLGLFEKWVSSRETSDKNTKRVMALLRKKMNDVAAYDCSGLAIKWLLEQKAVGSDMSSDAMYRKCAKISRDELKRGDWVFVLTKSGIANHVGYIVDDNKTVIHSKGRDYGVIKEALSQHAWNAYGRPDFVFDLAVPIIFRTLKYTEPEMMGDDVIAVQNKLLLLGYQIGKADGIYGKKVMEAVTSFQKQQKLAVNGRVGKDTATALGLNWKK